MSKILLISSNTIADPYPVYPLGMAMVASALVRHGHAVEQFDCHTAIEYKKELSHIITRFEPDIIGISLRNLDTTDSSSREKWTLDFNRELIDHIHTITNAPVVMGGSAFSIMPEDILSYTGADFGVVGEGEVAFPALVKSMASGNAEERIIRSNSHSRTDLDRSGPLWDLRLLESYQKGNGIVGIQTKRGCNYRCSYCTYPLLEGKKVRCKEPGLVADEIEKLAKDHSMRLFFFTDSVFNDPGSNYLEIAEEIARRDLNLEWSAFFRPHPMTRDEILLLKRSGLAAVEAGTDAACDTTLSELNKGFSFSDAITFNDAFVEARIPCIHYVMFGCPGETHETVDESLRNLNHLRTSVVLVFSGIRVLPDTSIYTRAINDKIIKDGEIPLRPVYYFSPAITEDVMEKRIKESFKGRRDRLFPPSEAHSRLRILAMFGFSGFLWTKLLSYE